MTLTGHCPTCHFQIIFPDHMKGREELCPRCKNTFFLSPDPPPSPDTTLPVAQPVPEPPPIPSSTKGTLSAGPAKRDTASPRPKQARSPAVKADRPTEVEDDDSKLTPEGRMWLTVTLVIGGVGLLYVAVRELANPHSPIYRWLNFWTFLAVCLGIIIGLLWRIVRALEKKND
jgi:hypothetical protein